MDSDKLSYIVLRNGWFNIIVLNLHASSEEKTIDSKTVFLGITAGFYHFPKYHMNILLGDFNAKVERENIFKPEKRNESLHHDNVVRIVKFAT